MGWVDDESPAEERRSRARKREKKVAEENRSGEGEQEYKGQSKELC